jgi:sugar lactone lactonase YvrE
MMSQWVKLLGGLSFPEGPRWRDGRLWLSDFYQHQVMTVDMDGNSAVVASVPNQPSGLGWLPDGRLLVVSMLDRCLLRMEGDGLVQHADLSAIATGSCNDMVVDAQGRAYVGNFGFDRYKGEPQRLATLALVHPDGRVVPAADGLAFPNGTVISDDGAQLIIGETQANRLTAFRVADDGSLHDRRVFADLGENFPDGICLDAEGAVWVSDPRNNEVIRVLDGGEVTHRLSTGDLGAYACMLGGPERKTLFVLANSGSGLDAAAKRDGCVLITQVDVAGAGLP